MALPRKLKDMNLYSEGESFRGIVTSVTLPKLARKLEDYRGAGMDGTVKLDQGAEAMEMEFTLGGPELSILRQFARPGVAGSYLRFAGAWQDEGTGVVDIGEITVRGRFEEMDFGEMKPGEGGEFKCKFQCAYFRLEWNGEELAEIDPLNGIYRIAGEDRLAGWSSLLA
ncbi:phage major tail tube protein [Sphingomonas pituitosa]|uniref:phage major tail tube protein n=1 Tax=Sphingomonas pituitosa TaxID=99597 RepID=UPI00082C17F5|nr:phage major tail tube protein [Sphingomonas pituitosa]